MKTGSKPATVIVLIRHYHCSFSRRDFRRFHWWACSFIANEFTEHGFRHHGDYSSNGTRYRVYENISGKVKFSELDVMRELRRVKIAHELQTRDAPKKWM